MLSFVALILGAQSATLPMLAIEHVSVVTMERDAVIADQTVVVRDGKIEVLGPASEVKLPEGAQRIDGHDRFLMPGLADMHVHVWDENDLYLFVANGVTTVRNMFGDPLQLGWRARIDAGELVGPRLYTAGPIVDGKSPVWPGSIELTDPTKADAVVAEQKAAGYDLIKPYSRLDRACYDALAVAAAKHGLRMMGHVPDKVGLEAALAAKQTTIEHLTGFQQLARDASPKLERLDFAVELGLWQTMSDERIAAVARATHDAGTWNCPTLVTMHKWSVGDEAAELLARSEMRYVSPFMKSAWEPTSPMNYLVGMSPELLDAAHAALPFQQKVVKALHDAGAGILLGTDMANPFVVAGFSTHEEVELLVGAGLTPYEALRAGTADAARCMNASDEWGTIAVGKRADLVLLSANPLVDVRNASKRVGVILRGRWMPEEELHTELERRAASFVVPESK
ncbi:MAG: amidohydrolase family protein [Planctomycetes bacterium]|nr:amidohydrolase family protein [Planctomycetota bacterium]